MLHQLYPKVHRRYTSLPVLGPILDGFGAWLLKQGYSTDCVREHFAPCVDSCAFSSNEVLAAWPS
jgi:hypothetical protein